MLYQSAVNKPDLKRKSEILATLLPKKGKKLPQNVNLIVNFYKSDKNSRQMPGKKNYMSIKKNQHEHKCLVVCNLHELYVAFKEQNPNM